MPSLPPRFLKQGDYGEKTLLLEKVQVGAQGQSNDRAEKMGIKIICILSYSDE